MLVLFGPSPNSIVKAFVASRVYRAKPVDDSDKKKFYFEYYVESESLDYDSLFSQYK